MNELNLYLSDILVAFIVYYECIPSVFCKLKPIDLIELILT